MVLELLIYWYIFFTGLLDNVYNIYILHLYLCIFQRLPSGPHFVPGRGLSDLSPLALCGQGVLLHALRMQEQDTGGMKQ